MSNADIPPDWRSWIHTNRERGCTEASMLDAMQQSGVDTALAQTWLAACAAEPASAATATSTTTDTAAPARTRPGDTELYQYDASRLPPHNVIQLPDASVRISLRLEQPDIAVIDNLLSADECDALIALAQTRLQGSTVVDPASGQQVPNHQRSSEGAMFQRGETPLIASVEQRIAALIHWPLDHAEGLQVLHYRPGGEYRPHYDYFPPDHPGSSVQMRTGGQRVATLVMYLNDVPDGGATFFPLINLHLTPRRGSAVWFSYCNAQGQLDAATLHGGAPVLQGEKWIMTKWLRERHYG